MSIIDNLVTDRTADDVEYAKGQVQKVISSGIDSLPPSERLEYLDGLKGAYNAKDLNRVGEAANYIYDLCNSFGVRPKGYKRLKTNWVCAETHCDIPTYDEMEKYISMLKLLKTSISGKVNTVSESLPDNMDNFSYESANNIEKMLVKAYEVVIYLERRYYFSGELFCGEV